MSEGNSGMGQRPKWWGNPPGEEILARLGIQPMAGKDNEVVWVNCSADVARADSNRYRRALDAIIAGAVDPIAVAREACGMGSERGTPNPFGRSA